MINYVIINGVNSNTINGLGINELPPISKPSLRVLTEEIDGRDGDITTNLGYSAYDKTITIGLFGTGYDVNDIISFFTSEGTITFSNEPDKYYKFTMLEQIDVESLLRFKTASITFHCQPFKYPLSETPLEIEYDYIEQTGETLTLNNTGEATLDLSLKGNTSQTGTPTPSSPIPINVVSGDNEVVVCGINFWDEQWELGTFNTTTGDNNSSTTQIRSKNLINIFPSTLYYFRNPTSSNIGYWIMFYDKEGNIITGYNPSTNNSKSGNCFKCDTSKPTIMTPTNAKKMKFYLTVDYGATYNNDICINISNASINGNYYPYQSQTYHITLPNGMELCKIGDYQDYFTKNSGKNLFDVSAITENTYLNGGGGTGTSSVTNISDYIEIDSSTDYTLSYDYATLLNTNYRGRCFYDDNKTYISGNEHSPANKVQTFTTPSGAKYVRFAYDKNCSNIQLEKGQPTTYEPYGTGQWCKYNAIGKVDLSSLTWTPYAFGYGFKRYTTTGIANIKYASVNTELVHIFAEKYREHTGSGMSSQDAEYCLAVDVSMVQAVDLEDTTPTGLFYYPLKTPYLSLIEDETLISQLDNIQNAMSYEGQTNVMQNNNDKPFIISAKALEQGSDEVVVNNIGNATSKPLIALEGTGNINIYLDGTQVLQANVEDKMNIDIDKLEAYNPDTSALLNRQVTGNYNSMTLPSGNSTIKIDGNLTSATITNYTRWL